MADRPAATPQRRSQHDSVPATSGIQTPSRLLPAARLPAPSRLPPPSLAFLPQTRGWPPWNRSGLSAAVVGGGVPSPTARVLNEQSCPPPSAAGAVDSGAPSPWYETCRGGRSSFSESGRRAAPCGNVGDAYCDGEPRLRRLDLAPDAVHRGEAVRHDPLGYSKYLGYRSIVCGIAICLLWMTSLSATRYLVQTALVSPPLLLVASECRRTYSEALRQKADYARCISVQLKQCDEALAASAAAEEERASSAAAANTMTLDGARVTRIRCSAARAQALAALRALQRRGGLLQWDGETCSAEEIHSVKALV